MSSWPGNPHSGEPVQVVRSPEQVALRFPVAGPTSRMLAYAIDVIAIGLLEVGLIVGVMLATPLAEKLADALKDALPKDPGPASQAEMGSFFAMLMVGLVLLQIAIEWGYFTFFELVTGGRSPGKRVVGLRVVRDGGLPLTLRESLLRNLMRAVDMLPAQYLVGLVAMVMSDDGKRLGDLVAGTIVIRTDAAPAPRALPIAPPGAISAFRFERAQLERLGAPEGALIRQALRRSAEFPPAQADAIVGRAAEALCAKLDHPPVPPAEQRAFLLALLEAARGR